MPHTACATAVGPALKHCLAGGAVSGPNQVSPGRVRANSEAAGSGHSMSKTLPRCGTDRDPSLAVPPGSARRRSRCNGSGPCDRNGLGPGLRRPRRVANEAMNGCGGLWSRWKVDLMIGLPPRTRWLRVPVEGTELAYLEIGRGEPVLFLHGNPTSSLFWREVIGPVADTGCRCLALDLVGMGRSGKPDIEYRLVDHIRYVEGFVEGLGLSRLSIVGHDWGAVLALDYARRFPARVRAVAFLEGHIHPIEHWSDMDAGGRHMFQRLREPGTGEQMVSDGGELLHRGGAARWDAADSERRGDAGLP